MSRQGRPEGDTLWNRLPVWAQAISLLGAVALTSFGGGVMSTEWGDLPTQVARNDSAIHEVSDQHQRQAARDELIWFYVICRLDDGDGRCEYILPPDLQIRLRNIRTFVEAAPPFRDTIGREP